MWSIVKIGAWVSGLGVVLLIGISAASLAAFGYEGEGWVFLLPALPLCVLFLVLMTILVVRRFARLSRRP